MLTQLMDHASLPCQIGSCQKVLVTLSMSWHLNFWSQYIQHGVLQSVYIAAHVQSSDESTRVQVIKTNDLVRHPMTQPVNILQCKLVLGHQNTASYYHTKYSDKSKTAPKYLTSMTLAHQLQLLSCRCKNLFPLPKLIYFFCYKTKKIKHRKGNETILLKPKT